MKKEQHKNVHLLKKHFSFSLLRGEAEALTCAGMRWGRQWSTEELHPLARGEQRD